MLKRLMRNLGRSLMMWGSAPHDGTKPAPARASATASVASTPDATTEAGTFGCVEFLGIPDLKRKLGTVWPEVQARARPVMNDVLSAHLHPEDRSAHRDDETIMIRFVSADTTACRARVQAITDDIAARLLRDVPESEPLTLQSRTAPAPAVRDDGDVFATAAAALDGVQADTEAITKRARRYLLNAAGIIYRPIWNSHQSQIFMFQAHLDDVSSQTALETIRILSCNEEATDTIADIDIVLLRQSIEHLHMLLAKRSKAFFMVPISFQTLYIKRARDAYTDICRRIPQSHGNYIVFEIYGIPSGTRAERLAELADKVRGFSKGVFVRDPDMVDRVSALANSAVTGIAIAVDHSAVNEQEELATWVNKATHNQMRVLRHGVNTRASAATAYQLGVVLLAGDAIATKLETPVTPYRWRLHLEPGAEAGKASHMH